MLITTPKPKHQTLTQITSQPTVKPYDVPEYSLMDYQTFRPVTKLPTTNIILSEF